MKIKFADLKVSLNPKLTHNTSRSAILQMITYVFATCFSTKPITIDIDRDVIKKDIAGPYLEIMKIYRVYIYIYIYIFIYLYIEGERERKRECTELCNNLN